MSFVTHEQQSLVWLASPLLGGCATDSPPGGAGCLRRRGIP